jgi:hypothetical protein
LFYTEKKKNGKEEKIKNEERMDNDEAKVLSVWCGFLVGGEIIDDFSAQSTNSPKCADEAPIEPHSKCTLFGFL